MSKRRRRTWVAILSATTIVGGATSIVRAEEQVVRAEASWQGRMHVYVMGPQEAFMLGVFTGRLVVVPESSALHGAELLCPGVVDGDYGANAIRSTGHCVITTRNADRIFARWSCTGEPEKSCVGQFLITGGTGAYQGVTGEGDLTIQLTLSDLTRLNQLESDYDVKGQATWPALRYRTP
jgi:hypothetical protein